MKWSRPVELSFWRPNRSWAVRGREEEGCEKDKKRGKKRKITPTF